MPTPPAIPPPSPTPVVTQHFEAQQLLNLSALSGATGAVMLMAFSGSFVGGGPLLLAIGATVGWAFLFVAVILFALALYAEYQNSCLDHGLGLGECLGVGVSVKGLASFDVGWSSVSIAGVGSAVAACAAALGFDALSGLHIFSNCPRIPTNPDNCLSKAGIELGKGVVVDGALGGLPGIASGLPENAIDAIFAYAQCRDPKPDPCPPGTPWDPNDVPRPHLENPADKLPTGGDFPYVPPENVGEFKRVSEGGYEDADKRVWKPAKDPHGGFHWDVSDKGTNKNHQNIDPRGCDRNR